MGGATSVCVCLLDATFLCTWQAGNMLMGSVMYFDSVDVMLILGTSFKYRRNEVTRWACSVSVPSHLFVYTHIVTCRPRSFARRSMY